jgi:hypothetical protein
MGVATILDTREIALTPPAVISARGPARRRGGIVLTWRPRTATPPRANIHVDPLRPRTTRVRRHEDRGSALEPRARSTPDLASESREECLS